MTILKIIIIIIIIRIRIIPIKQRVQKQTRKIIYQVQGDIYQSWQSSTEREHRKLLEINLWNREELKQELLMASGIRRKHWKTISNLSPSKRSATLQQSLQIGKAQGSTTSIITGGTDSQRSTNALWKSTTKSFNTQRFHHHGLPPERRLWSQKNNQPMHHQTNVL